MNLYNFPFGPYPQRVRIYLAEKGVTGVELVESTSKANCDCTPSNDPD
jgi:Glutathione S-transferase, N-terminal domain